MQYEKPDKKIIFYTYQENDKYVQDGMINGYTETKEAIKNGVPLIKTTQMLLLSSETAAAGYELWVKEPKRDAYSFILREDGLIDCDMTDKQLRYAHNLYKMWLAGAFN